MSLSKIGLETAPETSTQMLASIKMTNPRNHARRPADFRVLTNPFLVTQLTNPFMPPEYCVKVIMAPIIAENRTTLVLSASWNTETSTLTVWMRPVKGFQLWIMVQPNQIPNAREI